MWGARCVFPDVSVASIPSFSYPFCGALKVSHASYPDSGAYSCLLGHTHVRGYLVAYCSVSSASKLAAGKWSDGISTMHCQECCERPRRLLIPRQDLCVICHRCIIAMRHCTEYEHPTVWMRRAEPGESGTASIPLRLMTLQQLCFALSCVRASRLAFS